MKKGFSLIEVVVTVIILGVVIAGIIPVINKAFVTIRLTTHKMTAHKLAQERLEELQLANVTYLADSFFESLYNATGYFITDPAFQELGNSTMSGNEPYGDLNITDPSVDPFMNFRRLTEGSWDIDQDGDVEDVVANPLSLDRPGNLSLIQVSVWWDDNVDPITVSTFKSAY